MEPYLNALGLFTLLNLAWWTTLYLITRLRTTAQSHKPLIFGNFVVTFLLGVASSYVAGIFPSPTAFHNLPPSDLIASFAKQTDTDVNAYGIPWDGFDDQRITGHSKVWWNNEKPSELSRTCCRLHVTLDNPDESRRPYAGMYSNFFNPPNQSYDFSKYLGLSINCKVEGNEVVYYMQVATMNIHDDAYYELEIPYSQNDKGFTTCQLRFVDFAQPSIERLQADFELQQSFRIAVLARPRNNDGKVHTGVIWIDSIQLFR